MNSSACYTSTTPTSGGSSGGGGGSSSSSKSQTFVVGDITASMPLTTGKGDIINFNYKGQKHKIEITKINSRDIELRISSKTIELIISAGETKEVDIDGDNIKDLRIQLAKISSNKAYMSIDLIRQNVNLPICNNNICELGESKTNCPNDCSENDAVVLVPVSGQQPRVVQQIVTEEPSGLLLYRFIGILFALLLFGLGYVVYSHNLLSSSFREKPRQIFQQRPIITQEASLTQDPYSRLDSYVKQMIAMGYQKDAIKEKLLSLGWKKEIVDNVFDKIK